MRHHDLSRVDIPEVQQGVVGLDPPLNDQLGLLFLPQQLRAGLPGVAQEAVRPPVELLLAQLGARLQTRIGFVEFGSLELIGVGRERTNGYGLA